MEIINGRVKPIHDDVLVFNMQFDQRVTKAGIIIPNDDGMSSGIRPRWGQVYDIGPEQKWIKKNEWILVEHGRWTRGVSIEDDGLKVIRKVDLNAIMAISDEEINE